MKSARKRQFRNVWVGGGAHFSAWYNTLDGAHKHGTAPFIHFYSESLSSSAFSFSGRAGTPLGQTPPCLWTGTYVAKPWWGVSFDPKTGQQKWWPQRPSECRAPCGCMQVAANHLYRAFLPDYQAAAESPEPALHPQSEPFCAPKAFVVHRGKQQPVE